MVFVKGEWLTLYKALVDQDDKENINTVLFSKVSMSLRSVNVGERERSSSIIICHITVIFAADSMIVYMIHIHFTERSFVPRYSLLVYGKICGKFTVRSFVVSGDVQAAPIVSVILDNTVS